MSKNESSVLSSCLPTNFGLDGAAVAVLSSSSTILVSGECSFSFESSFADTSYSFGFSMISSTLFATPSTGVIFSAAS